MAPTGLYAELKKLRLKLARSAGVPPFAVFTDATLQKISTMLPKTEDDFLKVPGVGKIKCERYATAFLALVSQYC
jgi:ATP-dependent DNA helicase RecQ